MSARLSRGCVGMGGAGICRARSLAIASRVMNRFVNYLALIFKIF